MTDNELTEIIINYAYHVHNSLGAGFLEKVYQNAMFIEAKKRGLDTKQQYPIKVYYDSQIVGDYIADLRIEERIIVELKAVQSLTKEHEMQLVNYLVATEIETGLLINFGASSVQIRRKFRDYKPKSNPINPEQIL